MTLSGPGQGIKEAVLCVPYLFCDLVSGEKVSHDSLQSTAISKLLSSPALYLDPPYLLFPEVSN